MEYEDVKVGQKVIINDNLDRTARSYGVTLDMKKMKGRIFTVTRKDYSGTYPLVKLGDPFAYSWHPNDLTEHHESETETETDKPEQLFHYNIEELVI